MTRRIGDGRGGGTELDQHGSYGLAKVGNVKLTDDHQGEMSTLLGDNLVPLHRQDKPSYQLRLRDIGRQVYVTDLVGQTD